MKIAISKNGGFSDRWIDYCKKEGIDYKIVNAYDSDIIEQVSDCDAFMWHHHHNNYKDALFSKQLLFSLQHSGKSVFPDFNTGWHFDDKVGQKYLLEAIGAPLVPSYVFYTKKEALDWVEKTTFPKVFKLRGGAGATNVRLAKTKGDAKRLIKRAFGKGFAQKDFVYFFKDMYKQYKNGIVGFKEVMHAFTRIFVGNQFAKMHAPEKGYVYFQDFIPNNKADLRVCVVSNKAFALKRLVRKGDFRASGSGNIIFDRAQLDERCVSLAFKINKTLKAQSIAFDFVFDQNNNPLVVEISFGYAVKAYDNCEGYWTDDMVWHEGSHFDFCGWMVDDIITKVNVQNNN